VAKNQGGLSDFKFLSFRGDQFDHSMPDHMKMAPHRILLEVMTSTDVACVENTCMKGEMTKQRVEGAHEMRR